MPDYDSPVHRELVDQSNLGSVTQNMNKIRQKTKNWDPRQIAYD